MAPAADPKRLQILQAVKTALQGINGGSTYWNTVRSDAVQLDTATTLLGAKVGAQLPAFVVEASDRGERPQPEGALIRKHVFEFVVLGRMDASGRNDGDKKVTVGEKLAHDIEKALMATERLGLPSLVNQVSPGEPEVVYDAGPALAVFVGVRVRVEFKRRLGQP